VLSERFDDALVFANRLHAGDVRKGSTVPYVAHLLGVCALVLVDGGGEDEAVAALLHDALEDHPTETSWDEIEGRFGPEVLAIVVACTDTPPDYAGGPKAPWRERKEAYLAHLAETSPGALRVSLADKVDNARSILADYRVVGDDLWTRFKAGKEDQLRLYRRLVEAFRDTGATGFLVEELERTVSELERLAAGAAQSA
jgi:GTP pyrophosphokinase